jgi:L-2-hydroxyglutarate oxidase LhgO
VRLLSSGELLELEPHVRGVAALHSPTTAIVDFGAVTRVLGRLVGDAGGTILTGHRVTGLRHDGPQVRVSSVTADGERDHVFDRAILCGGLQSDRLARLVGGDRYPAIVPFRGEYLSLVPDRRDLVNGLVYPVPDPRYPFLGTHFTPRVDGEVLIGPNAVLALAREGYRWSAVSARDLGALATAPGFWRFAARHWRTGIYEVRGSLVRKAFIARARQYVPGLSLRDVVPGPRGVRAQAMSRHGDLLDDFDIQYGDRVVAVRNAPSPAATSALAIAEHVVADVSGRWGWS